MTRDLVRRLDAPAVLSGDSRLVADCNRRIENPAAMPEVSDGIEVPGNRGLSDTDRAAREAACHRPYHQAIADRLADFAAAASIPQSSRFTASRRS